MAQAILARRLLKSLRRERKKLPMKWVRANWIAGIDVEMHVTFLILQGCPGTVLAVLCEWIGG
jgi:hypothetical protein